MYQIKKQQSLPEGWYVNYESKPMLCTVDVDSKTSTSAPFEYNEEENGYLNSDLYASPDGRLMGITNKWTYNEDYTESTSTYNLLKT